MLGLKLAAHLLRVAVEAQHAVVASFELPETGSRSSVSRSTSLA